MTGPSGWEDYARHNRRAWDEIAPGSQPFVGDLVTALAGAGLRITSLQEFPSDQPWRWGELWETGRKFPGQLLLVAERD